jgi:hypothetical protein
VQILAKSPHAAFSTQGSFLAQSWLRLPAAHHRFLVDSLLKTTPAALVEIAKSQTTCPVLETALSSPSVTGKDKRALMLKFLGHYHTLADDRNASRAADACWAAADVYLKVRLQSAIEQADAAAGQDRRLPCRPAGLSPLLPLRVLLPEEAVLASAPAQERRVAHQDGVDASAARTDLSQGRRHLLCYWAVRQSQLGANASLRVFRARCLRSYPQILRQGMPA